MLKLKVENIGPIESAEIELNQMTAIIGPNSAGKTFLSLVLLSLSDIFTAFPMFFPSPEMDKGLLGTVDANRGTKTYQLEFSELNSMFERHFRQNFENSLQSNFGVPYAFLIKEDSTMKKTIISIEDERMEMLFGLSQQQIEFRLHVKKDFAITIDQVESAPGTGGSCSIKDGVIKLRVSSDMPSQQRINLMGYQIQSLIVPDYFKSRSEIFLPTERGLIVSIFNVLTSWYVSSYGSQILAQQLGIPRQEAPIQTDRASVGRFIKDFLQKAATSSRDRSDEYHLPFRSKNISFKITQPLRIEVEENNHSIPLGLLSSGYSQTIPLVFFQNFTNLIIEEPELNLHAGQQIDVANFLYSLKGNIFLTTHSDRFLVQIGINHKKNKKDVKIYLLDDGRTKEKKILDNGDIEQFESISEALNEQAKELSS